MRCHTPVQQARFVVQAILVDQLHTRSSIAATSATEKPLSNHHSGEDLTLGVILQRDAIHRQSAQLRATMEASQPTRSSAWHPPATPDAVPDPPTSDLPPPDPGVGSSASPSASVLASKGRGGAGNQVAAVDALASGMSGLCFEETGEDENYNYGRGDFIEHACRYCGVQNPACVVRCNVPSCRKWFCNSRENASIGIPHRQ